MQKYLKITWRFHKSDMELRKFCKRKRSCKNFVMLKRSCEFFAMLKRSCENFANGEKWCEIFFCLSKISKVVAKFSSILRKFRKWLQNSLVLDFFSDSLPCTLDWFGKGFEALQNLDSSCNLASILLCHGLYQVLPHSWLVLMIKKLSKTSKLTKNWLVTVARVFNMPIELKGNKYYSKVFKSVYKKL